MTDVYTPQSYRTCQAPGHRTVVPAVVNLKGDLLVPIPFRGKLVAFQTSTTVVITSDDVVIGLEKDVAGGTLLGAVTVLESGSAVGTEDIGTLTAGLTEEQLTIDNQDICLAVTGEHDAGQVNVFMIFEHGTKIP